MYNINKVRLSMFGVEYVVNTSEEPSYVKQLANEIENIVQSALDRNSSTSLSEAYMLCCLNFADRYKKAEQNADHL
ncbi:MAG: cell division protein ZapA, partial [Oscillospiraceae bacterium]